MTGLEFQASFEQELNRKDSTEIVDSNDILFWLNEAIIKFVKTRYSGLNSKRESFEETQKRIDDLRTLTTEVSLTSPDTDTYKPDSFLFDLPDGDPNPEYWLALGEEVLISYTSLCSGSTTKRTGITECTTDTYRSKYDDPYGEYILHYETAYPLRLFIGNQVEFITDGSYDITTYYLRYLRRPLPINIDTSGFRNSEYTELPRHTHNEIVKMAVNMYLENQEERRYQSHLNEVNTME